MDENYSDDSLEVPRKNKKKSKINHFKTTKSSKTYLQIYERRLMKDSFNPSKPCSEVSKLDEKATIKEHKPRKTDQKSLTNCQKLVNPSADRRTENENSSKIHFRPSLISFYLLPKSNLSNSSEKNEVLKKRLEYGKLLRQINKINRNCANVKKNKDGFKNVKIHKECEKTEKDLNFFSLVAQSQIGINILDSEHCSKEIQNLQEKLESLKFRHKKDSELVEGIRRSCNMKRKF